MQIQAIQPQTSQLPQTNTNFKALRRVVTRYDLKQYPEYATKILETVKDSIKKDKEVAKLVDRFDCSIVLLSHRNIDNRETRMDMFYRNPNESLLKRFTNLFLGIPKDKCISLSGWGQGSGALQESVDYLIKGIKEYGYLDSQARLVNEEFDKKLAKKEAKVFVRKKAEEAKSQREIEINNGKEKLDKLIEEMTTKKEV